MSQEKFAQLLQNWQEFLGLAKWEITVDFENPCGPESNAKTFHSVNYDSATITLAEEWGLWPEEFTNKIIAHELLHLVMRDLQEAFTSIENHLYPAAYEALADRFDHELEGVIDRMANRLVELTYV